jgi:hypothetical protein
MAGLTHSIVIPLHLVAESSTICSSRSRQPVRKLLDTPSYNSWHSRPSYLNAILSGHLTVCTMSVALCSNVGTISFYSTYCVVTFHVEKHAWPWLLHSCNSSFNITIIHHKTPYEQRRFHLRRFQTS